MGKLIRRNLVRHSHANEVLYTIRLSGQGLPYLWMYESFEYGLAHNFGEHHNGKLALRWQW